jgi:hypothetical protein
MCLPPRARALHSYIYVALITLALMSHYRAAKADPGRVPKNAEPVDENGQDARFIYRECGCVACALVCACACVCARVCACACVSLYCLGSRTVYHIIRFALCVLGGVVSRCGCVRAFHVRLFVVYAGVPACTCAWRPGDNYG